MVSSHELSTLKAASGSRYPKRLAISICVCVSADSPSASLSLLTKCRLDTVFYAMLRQYLPARISKNVEFDPSVEYLSSGGNFLVISNISIARSIALFQTFSSLNDLIFSISKSPRSDLSCLLVSCKSVSPNLRVSKVPAS